MTLDQQTLDRFVDLGSAGQSIDRADAVAILRSTDDALPGLVAAAQHPGEGWKAAVQTLPVAPDNLHWRTVRHALVASYDHWDRPIRLDPLLQRQLGDRAQRDAAARGR